MYQTCWGTVYGMLGSLNRWGRVLNLPSLSIIWKKSVGRSCTQMGYEPIDVACLPNLPNMLRNCLRDTRFTDSIWIPTKMVLNYLRLTPIFVCYVLTPKIFETHLVQGATWILRSILDSNYFWFHFALLVTIWIVIKL